MELAEPKTTKTLSESDRQLLAREVAADKFEFNDSVDLRCEECGHSDYYNVVESDVIKDAVKFGWDAALGWTSRKE